MISDMNEMHPGPDRFELEGRHAPKEFVNDVIRLMSSHRSVRGYRPDPLPQELLDVLATAAQSASTSSNLQTYSIIAVQDGEKKKLIAEWSVNPFAVEAPLILVFCPDLHRMEVVCRRQGYDFVDRDMEMFIQSVVDAALAAQNTALAAESLGLGICYLGGVRNETAKMADLLRLPPRTFALFGMTVGYPARPSRVRHRLPADIVLHHDEYSDANLDAGLNKYDEITAESGIYHGRHVKLKEAGRERAEGESESAQGTAQRESAKHGATEAEPMDPNRYGWSEHSARRMAQPNAKRMNMMEQLKNLGWEF